MNGLGWTVELNPSFIAAFTSYSAQYPHPVVSEPHAEALPQEKAELEALVGLANNIRSLKNGLSDPEALPAAPTRAGDANFRMLSQDPWTAYFYVDSSARKCSGLRLFHKRDVNEETIKPLLEKAMEDLLNG